MGKKKPPPPKPRQVYWAQVPYTNSTESNETAQVKKRPVVIIGWSNHKASKNYILVAPITTFGGKPNLKLETDIEIIDLKLAGLTRESWIQPARIMSLDEISLSNVSGWISMDQWDKLIDSVASLLDPPEI